jgi:hypothetical protein
MKLSRRTLLRSATGAAIALPWLEAFGQAAPPRRMVLFFSANGTVYSRWAPTQGAGGLQLSPILAPLEPHKAKVLVVGNIDVKSANFGPGDGHGKGIGHLWTGTEMWESPNAGSVWWAGGPSVDQVAAEAIGRSTPLRSLELGVQVQAARVWDRMSYRASAQPLPPELDPQVAFDRLFASFDGDPMAAGKRRARRKSVLDGVMAEMSVLQPKVSGADRQRLDSHFTAVRELERRLDSASAPAASCQAPTRPGTVVLTDPALFEQIGRAQMDLLAMALACDLTRVASVQYSSSTSAVVFRWLGATEDHHELSHRADEDLVAQAQLERIHHWYSQQFAWLLARLDSLAEGSGSVLDHSLVVWGNELGKGNNHSHTQVPFVLAGGAGGALNTGRFVDAQRAAHNDLLVSCLNAVGVPATTFGNPAYCSGPLPGLGV